MDSFQTKNDRTVEMVVTLEEKYQAQVQLGIGIGEYDHITEDEYERLRDIFDINEYFEDETIEIDTYIVIDVVVWVKR